MSIAASQETVPEGWVAGPEEDAVIEVGQRFDCTGAGCPAELSCLYALGPTRPPGSWPIDTGFMLDETRMPWADVEVWFVEKAKALRPELAYDPLVRSDRFAMRTPPQAVDLRGGEYVLRRYVVAAKRRNLDLDAYLWNIKGRLRIMFCLQPAAGTKLRPALPMVEDLLAYLRRDDPPKETD
ncbi:hypothetical protein [Aurantimonas sp. 22II-16-19i]|uniref:hypothetical protein n=1 Tax=Aurantimonas sp. 22II-16-19i TaxID=1317114 RepID=UPI0009F7B0B6|nr:hypothetical protein [Aurantimonas sp. 22II-16-19i]ORE91112.1 hypothetical protein ATO4_19489 [Aurantimonas sp. 22II-16-19i]